MFFERKYSVLLEMLLVIEVDAFSKVIA